MLEVYKLYPQYRIQPDRRKQNIQVSFDRRSGADRRAPARISLDTNLTRDIFEIKNKVSKIHNTENSKLANTITNIPFGQKVLDTYQLLKSQNLNNKSEKVDPVNNSKFKSNAAVTAGMFTAMLAGVMASFILGPAAGVVGIGLGFYFGSRIFKHIISTHLKK